MSVTVSKWLQEQAEIDRINRECTLQRQNDALIAALRSAAFALEYTGAANYVGDIGAATREAISAARAALKAAGE